MRDSVKTPVKKSLIITSLIVLSLAVVGLSIALGVTYGGSADAENYKNLLENEYQNSYYGLVAEVETIDVNLTKLLASSGAEMQEELLYEVWKGTESAATALSHLSSRETSISETMRFVNQTGDYCFFLAKKIGVDVTLATGEKETLRKMRDMYKSLRGELQRIHDELQGGYLFMDFDGGGVLSEVFSGLNENSVEYPQMIYDGPFSDSLTDKEVKGLKGDDIDETRGRELLAQYFEGAALENIKFDGEWNTDIDTLNFSLTVDGVNVSAQLAKKGGSLIQYSADVSVNADSADTDACSAAAEEFATQLGFENMETVWVSDSNGTVYCNLAPVVDGIVYYPDLVKVKVSGENLKIIGLDSRNYAFNHVERQLDEPTLTHDEAKARVDKELSPKDGRLTLIPRNDGSEKLAYEFEGEMEGMYLIYIDAMTGKEINILYVVDTGEGMLLM
ncbi:MAG: germination protein YpeB [Clostridiaceae bacterium]|jgi:germination protein YpeB|nr:germination protein YpeB [Clostridiaceae bacterium]